MLTKTSIAQASHRPQVLICDDDTSFSSELIEVLHMRGYVASAVLTLTAIRAAIVAPNFLLLDVCMPQPDGFEVLKMLASHVRKQHFKIVMISGGNESLLNAAGKFCELNDLDLVGTMCKPIAVRELCDLIDSAIYW